MGKWMQKFGNPTAVPGQVLTDNTDRRISDSALSAMSVTHIRVSEKLNEEKNNQKITLPVTDNTDIGDQSGLLSVMSVSDRGSFLQNQEINEYSETPIPLTDNTDRRISDSTLSVMSVTHMRVSEKLSEKENNQKVILSTTESVGSIQGQALSKFCSLVRHVGASNGKLLDNAEILLEMDVEGLRELNVVSREVRLAWATAVAQRLIRKRGLIPNGWDYVAHCANCGPVWSPAAFEILSCPCCELRSAGAWLPQPLNRE